MDLPTEDKALARQVARLPLEEREDGALEAWVAHLGGASPVAAVKRYGRGVARHRSVIVNTALVANLGRARIGRRQVVLRF